AGMLFGHHAYAAEASPTGNMLGLLLQLALIGGLVYLGFRLFRRRNDAEAPAQASYYAGGAATPMAAGSAPPAAAVNITDAAYSTCSDLLTGVQEAWSKGDLGRLRRFVTPEMLSYFSEELSRNASQGVENKVENVKLLKGDLMEAWQEDGFDYATASMTWSA